MEIPSVEKLRPIPRERYQDCIYALGHAEHGSDWQRTEGWGANAKRLHTEKYQRYLAAVLPLLGYEPRPTSAL